jgi:hypothetical protein
MLEHDESYGGSHLAMALVLDHDGDTEGVTRELSAAKRYWQDADRDLAELRAIEELSAGRARAAEGKGR